MFGVRISILTLWLERLVTFTMMEGRHPGLQARLLAPKQDLNQRGDEFQQRTAELRWLVVTRNPHHDVASPIKMHTHVGLSPRDPKNQSSSGELPSGAIAPESPEHTWLSVSPLKPPPNGYH